MADVELVQLLQHDVAAWNQWRERHDDRPDLSEANLRRTNLRAADLSRAYLYGADLSRVDLSGTDLSKARVGWTVFADISLGEVKRLETLTHEGPSTIGIDTIYKSSGNIPEVFLRGTGVPDTFIAYIGSLVRKAIKFYSCFISHSSLNQEFAYRLYADLQNHGVRCWFSPEDLKIGDEMRSSIDQSIRVHDKLLLVLSQQSIESWWVKNEVETAFERERREGLTVLFPIRLDDQVMATDEAWAADIRRTRHIGDFRGWKEHDAYRKAFDRLLRDLKKAAAAESTAGTKAEGKQNSQD